MGFERGTGGCEGDPLAWARISQDGVKRSGSREGREREGGV